MLVIAIGNRWRRDDGAGIEVAVRLKSERGEPVEIVESGDVLSIVERWRGQDLVVLVDAVKSGAAPGTVHRLEVTDTPLPAQWTFASSHQIGLAHAIEIGRAFEALPRRLVFVGIEGADFDFGVGLSDAVAAAVPAACAAVAGYLPAPVA